jgi:hypothetical protein
MTTPDEPASTTPPNEAAALHQRVTGLHITEDYWGPLEGTATDPATLHDQPVPRTRSSRPSPHPEQQDPKTPVRPAQRVGAWSSQSKHLAMLKAGFGWQG